MTQEEKELLFKDLCSRLPYGVKIYLEDFPNATLVGVVNDGIILHCDKYDYTYDTPWDIEYIKPYLFPLSSMTEEQRDEYISTCDYQNTYDINNEWIPTLTTFDWCNRNHFDYRGLIPMGLAKDCTNLNIY